eukprot:11196399-Lingulodinium_polyedra.AAC.1
MGPVWTQWEQPGQSTEGRWGQCGHMAGGWQETSHIGSTTACAFSRHARLNHTTCKALTHGPLKAPRVATLTLGNMATMSAHSGGMDKNSAHQ